jgi:hypothetical protein
VKVRRVNEPTADKSFWRRTDESVDDGFNKGMSSEEVNSNDTKT